MKKTIIAILQLQLVTLTLPAAVPLRWTVETSRVQPAVFEAYQGETLELEAALQSHGKPLAAPVNYSFFWQTNGMGSTYWEAPAQRGSGVSPLESGSGVSPLVGETNVLFATWLPAYDVGARVYNCFIGSPSNIYHAAFQLRLRPSPGALPNALPLPTPVIDFARFRVLNPPWGSGGGGGCDTNAVDALANSAVVTNALTVATTNRVAALETATNNLSSSVSGLASSKADRSELGGYLPLTGGSLSGKVDGQGWWLDSGCLYLGYGLLIGGDNRPVSIVDYGDAYLLNNADGHKWFYGDPDEQDNEIAVKGDISATNPTFSNEVAAVARTVTPPPSPTLRLFDEVRQCYWIGRMVNGVINWEVE